MEGWTLAIAIGSLLVSGYAVLRQWSAERRQLAERGRAHFTAVWSGHGDVILTNQGPGPARDVIAKLGRTNARDGYPAEVGDVRADYLAPPGYLRLSSTPRLSVPPTDVVHLEWRDNRSEVQRAHVTVPAPPTSAPSLPRKSTDLEAAVAAVARRELEAHERHLREWDDR